MKRTFILPALLLAGGSLLAQNQVPVSKHVRETASREVKAHRNVIDPSQASPVLLASPQNNAAPVAAKVMVYEGLVETEIGTSTYDLQTNNSIQNRLLDLGEGKLAAMFTYSSQENTTWTDRGSGYNHYDGSEWGEHPDSRIEAVRTGWPSIVMLGDGSEAFISHSTDDNSPASVFGKRATPGSGNWTLSTITDGSDDVAYTWNRMVAGGADGNTLHVIGHREFPELVTGDFTVGYLSYSRSTDGGATWDIVDTILPQIDSTLYEPFGGDSYAITAEGNTVAFVCGGTQKDVILMKSTDNGATWTKTIIWKFPIEKYDSNIHLIDTVGGNRVNSSDGSYSISLDSDDEAHVFFGNYFFANPDITDEFITTYPLTGGLFHWTEDYGAGDTINAFTQFDTVADVGSIFLPTSAPAIDFIAQYNQSLTGMPHSVIHSNGDIYLTYSATMDSLYDAQLDAGEEFERLFRHQFITRSTDNGVTWEDPKDLLSDVVDIDAGDVFFEGVYGNITIQNDIIKVMYQRDETPGINLQPADNNPHPVAINSMILVEVAVEDYNVIGIEENVVGVSSLFPNPADNLVNVRFELNEAQDVEIAVVNMVGQRMISKKVDGEFSNQVSLDIASLNAGVYFVQIQAGNSTKTEKLIIR
jgi:hypothetical protein